MKQRPMRSYRIPPQTDMQIRELARLLEISQAEVIAKAVDRLAQQETTPR